MTMTVVKKNYYRLLSALSINNYFILATGPYAGKDLYCLITITDEKGYECMVLGGTSDSLGVMKVVSLSTDTKIIEVQPTNNDITIKILPNAVRRK